MGWCVVSGPLLDLEYDKRSFNRLTIVLTGSNVCFWHFAARQNDALNGRSWTNSGQTRVAALAS